MLWFIIIVIIIYEPTNRHRLRCGVAEQPVVGQDEVCLLLL